MSTLRAPFLFALLSPGLAHPLDARSLDPPVPGIAAPPGSQIFPCTSTLNIALPSCATSPPHAYAATKMLYREVDCAGCLAVSLRTTRDNPCPAQTEAPLETVDGTTTEWETVCSPTSTLPLNYPTDGLLPRQSVSTTRPSCPTTLMIPVENTGATATVFREYVTVTSGVPCGGCDLVISTMVGGLGVIRPPGVTATAAVGTSTVYACEG